MKSIKQECTLNLNFNLYTELISSTNFFKQNECRSCKAEILGDLGVCRDLFPVVVSWWGWGHLGLTLPGAATCELSASMGRKSQGNCVV